MTRERIEAGSEVLLDLGNGRSVRLVAGHNDLIADEYARNGYPSYEAATTELFRQLCRRAVPTMPVILDIGAHTGLFSLLAAAENPTAQVYALSLIHI